MSLRESPVGTTKQSPSVQPRKFLSRTRGLPRRAEALLAMTLLFIVLSTSSIFAAPADSVKQKKKHKASDTIGMVNKYVIYYSDFRTMLYATIKANQKDSVVSDTAYTRYVNMTWDKIVTDAIIEEEIQKRKLRLTTDEVIAFLLKHPPKELRETFAKADSSFDSLGCSKYLRNPEPDLVRTRFLDHYQIKYEQDRLFAKIAPRSESEHERSEELQSWLAKQMAKAKIIDRRIAFGYY